MKIGADEIRAHVRSLPPLPRAVVELRAALADEGAGADRITAIVGRDPALTAAALRLANSSFYGVAGRIGTLRDAVQILGLGTLSAAVLTAAVMANVGRGAAACRGFDPDSAWRHAVATALSAEALARWRGLDADAAYVCGLLHDVGRLALAAHFPARFAATLERLSGHDELPIDVERELLGTDHAEVGALIAAHWKLPARVVDAIGGHHDAQHAGEPGVLDLLHVADNITYALGLSESADEIVPPLSPAAWERVGLSQAELPAFFAHVERRMQRFSVPLAA